MKFKQFLVGAKKNSYTTSGEFGEKRLADSSKELTFAEGEYRYRDRYFGYNPFFGEEVVWRNDKIFWGMNYYGEVTDEEINPDFVYGFLKKALKKVTEEAPFRGPKYFKEEEFEYFDSNEGDVESFRGSEEIKFKGKKIYYLYYHGGLVKKRTAHM